MRLVFLARLFYFHTLKVELGSKWIQGLKPKLSISYIVAAEAAAEKGPHPFCHSERSEESLFDLNQ